MSNSTAKNKNLYTKKHLLHETVGIVSGITYFVTSVIITLLFFFNVSYTQYPIMNIIYTLLYYSSIFSLTGIIYWWIRELA